MSVKLITTPRGRVEVSGNSNAELVWDSSFAARMNKSFVLAQMYVDNEVLRYCSRLLPLDTGMLEKSGTLGTIVGSGEVRYIAPYAAQQYYNTAVSRPYDANRGAQWFERMKVAHKDDILAGVGKVTRATKRG